MTVGIGMAVIVIKVERVPEIQDDDATRIINRDRIANGRSPSLFRPDPLWTFGRRRGDG